MRRARSIGLLALAYFFAAAAPALSAETLNRVVAIVNDDVITLYELNNRIKEMTGHDPGGLRLQDEGRFIEIRRKVLELLIDEKIAQSKIEELGIKVNSQSVDATIEKIKAANKWTQEDLLAKLKEEGLSYEAYREKVKKDIQRYQLIDSEVKSKIIITEEMIKNYYEEHIRDFSNQGGVRIASIFLFPEKSGGEEKTKALHRKGEKILEEIKSGADFGQLARQYSQGPGAEEGGDLGTFKIDQLEPKLKEMCESLSEGECSGLIDRPGGIQIIKLISKDDGRAKSLEEARPVIQDILFKEEVDRRYLNWIKELRNSAYTKIIF